MSSRRQFLGAAAAAAVLSPGRVAAVQSGDGAPRDEGADTAPQDTLSLDVFGSRTTDFLQDGCELTVTSCPADPTECAAVEIVMGPAVVGFSLTPEQANELAEELHATVDDWHRVSQDE